MDYEELRRRLAAAAEMGYLEFCGRMELNPGGFAAERFREFHIAVLSLANLDISVLETLLKESAVKTSIADFRGK